LDLKSLGYFVAAVDTGSITAAATQCHIAQPSITSAIKKLEDELEVVLLIRKKRGVTVTTDGADLYSTAKSLLQHAESIKNRFKESHVKNTLSIGVSDAISFDYLRQLIELLHGQPKPPEVKVVKEGLNNVNQDFDIRLTMDQGVAVNEEFIPCWQDRYCLVMPNDHPLAFKKDLKITDLHEQRFINRAFCDRNSLLVSVLNESNISLNFVAEVDNEEWALSLVESGVGLTIMPIPITQEKNDHCVIFPLEKVQGVQNVERSVGVAINYRKYTNPYFQQLAIILKEAFS
jgi:LysR family hydrogen peroxide-inducible transcriptional activator